MPRGLPESAPPSIPDHEMLREIGRGACGVVWLARNLMGIYRAVKIVYRDDPSGSRAYDREFEGIRRFEPISRSHPSQVNILHVGRSEDFFYYVMELADDAGEAPDLGADENAHPSSARHAANRQIDPETYAPKTLRSVLRGAAPLSGPEPEQAVGLAVSQCIEIGVALASALSHLHRHDLVHRDIKPSNIIFVSGLPKLADIGLVAGADERRSFVGTEGYVGLEGPGKPQADIYALGKVLYQMITGLDVRDYPRVPDQWKTSPEREELIAFNAVVMQATEGRCEFRYETAEELRSDLVRLQDKKVVHLKRELARARQQKRLILIGAAAAVLMAALIASFLVLYNRAAEQSRRRELRDIKLSQSRLRAAGWFTNTWARLGRAAAIRKDQEVLEQAMSALAGLDARPVCIREFEGASSGAFATDGRAVLSGLGTNHAVLFDTHGRRTELPVRGEGLVCWAPEGFPLHLEAASNALVLRNALTDEVRRRLPLRDQDPPLPASSAVLAVTPEGGLVAAGLGSQVLVWGETAAAQPTAIHTRASSLAFSPDGSFLGVGGLDGTARVYALPGLTEVAVLPPAMRGSPILCLAFSRDRVVPYGMEKSTNRWLLATGDQGAQIVIWDLARRLPRSFCLGSTWKVSALAFHPDGLLLASAGRNDARLWDVMSGQPILLLRKTSGGDSRALAFDREGRRLISGGEPGDAVPTIGLWELEPHRGAQALRGLASAARKVWFSRDSARLAALSDDWHLAIWDLASGRLLFLFETPVGGFADSAGGCFDAEATRFAFASGREACLYDLATGGVARIWRLARGLSDQVQFDSHGRPLLLRRERASIQTREIWRLFELGAAETPVLLHEQSDTNWSALDMRFAAGGERFLVWNGQPEGPPRIIRAYDAASGRELWHAATQRTAGAVAVVVDPTGQWFGYTADLSSRLRLVRFSDFTEIGTTVEFREAISPSGGEFVSGQAAFLDRSNADRAVPVVMDWQLLAFVSSFSPDGRLVAWGTEAGVVVVLHLEEVQQRLAGFRP